MREIFVDLFMLTKALQWEKLEKSQVMQGCVVRLEVSESVCGTGQCCLMRSAARTTTCRPPLTASPQRTMSAWPGLTLPSACVWQARPPGLARRSEHPGCALPLAYAR